jgi:hypothetical protein
MMEDNEEEENDDNYPMFPEYGGNARGEAEDKEAPDEPMLDDDLRRVIVDAQREAESANEKLKLERLLEDHKKKLYSTCEDGNTKLGTTLELLQWKAKNVVTDSGFEKLLKIMKRQLPRGN